jgi:hypothetical protein
MCEALLRSRGVQVEVVQETHDASMCGACRSCSAREHWPPFVRRVTRRVRPVTRYTQSTVALMRALLAFAAAFSCAAPQLFAASNALFAAPNDNDKDVVVAIRDGRATVIAKNATVSEILAAWARTGLTTIVNGDKLTSVPVTLELADVPERQALDVILRSASGYIAHLRPTMMANASQFDRVAIMPSSVAPRESSASPVQPFQMPAQPPFPQPAFQQGVVQRLIGPDGMPVADDQDEAPVPRRVVTPQGFQGGDSPPRAPDFPAPVTTGLPVSGVPVPGMMVPAPQPLRQQVSPPDQR